MAYLTEGKPSIAICSALTHELESLTMQARELLEPVAGRRKFDLHSPKGWYEVFGLLCSDLYDKKLPAEAITRLRRYCVRWQHLHRHLHFVASTRPVWNS